MITPTRASLPSRLAACIACVVLACSLAAANAVAAESTHYTDESMQAYEQQLASGQIASATINRRLRSLRLTLKDGTHVRVIYPPKTEPAVAAALAAKHVHVTVLTPAQAKAEAAKGKVHHKIRYIAGGVLIAIVVVVGAILLVKRRRGHLEE
jgi:Tfp pilus assembly protein PilV